MTQLKQGCTVGKNKFLIFSPKLFLVFVWMRTNLVFLFFAAVSWPISVSLLHSNPFTKLAVVEPIIKPSLILDSGLIVFALHFGDIFDMLIVTKAGSKGVPDVFAGDGTTTTTSLLCKMHWCPTLESTFWKVHLIVCAAAKYELKSR